MQMKGSQMNFGRKLAVLLTVSLLFAAARAQETEVSRKDVPPAVLAAFDKAYASAKVLEWEKEIHAGKVYYEAETVDAKVSRNVMYSPDGTVAQIVEKIAMKDLPGSVAESLKRLYPTATVKSAQKVIHADVIEYGLALSAGNPKKVIMAADGTIASTDGKTAFERMQ
jgi:hypothetical protein